MRHSLTVRAFGAGVTRDLSECRTMPLVAAVCGGTRGEGAQGGSRPAVRPATAPYLSPLGPILAHAERRLADRTVDLDAIAAMVWMEGGQR